MFRSIKLIYCLQRARFLLVSVLILFLGVSNTKAQISDENLPAYNRAKVHFGFIIAVNSANFTLLPISNLAGHFNDSLKTIRSNPQSEFNLGIVSELKIGKYLKLRFVPDLAFAERDLAYSFEGIDTFVVTKKINSTFVDFPLDLKLISKRQKNFEAYVVAGLKFTTDLASGAGINESLLGGNEVIRLIRDDYGYEAGGGLEFYLPYFKFSMELKLSQGVRNLLIPDNTVYTQSLEYLKSKVWLFSMTFEG